MAYRWHQELQNTKRHEDSPIHDPTKPNNAPVEKIYRRDWAETAVALGGLYGLTYEPNETRSAAATKPSTETVLTSEPDKTQNTKALRFPYRLKPIYWEGEFLLYPFFDFRKTLHF